MQRHSGTSARGESAKLKPEKAHTLTHTLTHDDNRCVCFVCNCNFRARFSFVVFVVVDGGAKQTFSFLLRYRFEYVECVCLYVSMCVYVVCVLVYRIYFFFMLFSSILFCNFVHVLPTFVLRGNYSVCLTLRDVAHS